MNQYEHHKILKLVLAIIILTVVIVGSYEFYADSKFRVVSTIPNTNSVATLSPFLEVSFNKVILQKSVSISSPSGVANKFRVRDKTLTIYLNYPLKSGRTYSIVIDKVSDVSGAEISDLNFTFSAKDIPYNDLPKDEQNALVNSQDQYHIQGLNITYNNTEDLINNGMSTTQLALLERYLSEFSPTAKTIAFVSNSIGIYAAPKPAIAMFEFVVSVDGTDYNAQASYTFLNNLSLSLFNQSGTLVFNSNTDS